MPLMLSGRTGYEMLHSHPSNMVTEIPHVMSERFQRSAAAQFIDETYRMPNRKGPLRFGGNDDEEGEAKLPGLGSVSRGKIGSSINTVINSSTDSATTTRLDRKGRLSNAGRGSFDSGADVMSPSPKIIVPSPRQRLPLPTLQRKQSAISALETGSVNSVHISARKHDDVPEVRSNAALYVPFQLSAKSSFNPTGLTARQLNRMDSLTKAKYKAYEAPPAHVAEQIRHSEQRSHRWLQAEHSRIQTIVGAARKRWELLHKAIEDPLDQLAGEQGAALAQRRMSDKIYKIMKTREDELQFLVEGQTTSIDAMRLKEFLVIKPNMPKIGKIYSKKDRMRVEELLA
ncbi:hypothetical protein BASA50_009407 [Batrachochytrium salamandrivorans]|uniref:Uncharacterized protein n=1 Tax=Batrachochytrium salamandrivorans TaxID=1357716 RepID=A0ABQ8F1L5_9FUNG|nr:hypothetical protein BASA62_003483 [Batrachochytrium salamandrivorans]KAH6581529.1 hypothetical protein BASA60_002361 [Batrachochytrium salamandrivorans]KAH6590432.1 hypothetical protein BASA50_009407 [Batrachochytrium salamandrivorans]KAH6599300.1 hypothetical protein BASA61_002611 [Batrachochytrium salamandrivorans]